MRLRSRGKTQSGGGGLNIHEDGLVLYLDAGITDSYGGSGNTWEDISPAASNDFTWDTAPSHTSGSAGYFDLTGATDDKGSSGTTGMSTGSSAFTVETWYRPDVINIWQSLWWMGTNSDDDGLFLGINDAGNPYVEFAGGGAVVGSGLTAATWYCIQVTFDGSNVDLFVNNSADGGTPQAMTTAFGTFEVGFNPIYTTDRADGRLAAIMVYDDELTSGERSTNYTEFTSRY